MYEYVLVQPGPYIYTYEYNLQLYDTKVCDVWGREGGSIFILLPTFPLFGRSVFSFVPSSPRRKKSSRKGSQPPPPPPLFKFGLRRGWSGSGHTGASNTVKWIRPPQHSTHNVVKFFAIDSILQDIKKVRVHYICSPDSFEIAWYT